MNRDEKSQQETRGEYQKCPKYQHETLSHPLYSDKVHRSALHREHKKTVRCNKKLVKK